MTMRTTVRLPDDLIRRAKRKAAAEGRTFTALVEEGLRTVLTARPGNARRKVVLPPVSTATGGLVESHGLTWENLSNDVQEMDDRDYVERMRRGFR